MAQVNPFDQFDAAPAQAPTQPAYPGIIRGAPKVDKPDQPKTTYRTLTPEEVSARGLPDGVYQVSSEGKVDKVSDGNKADDPNARADAVSKLRRVIDKIDSVALDAMDNGGWGETGTTGWVLGAVPGSAGYDLRGDLKTIDANTAFDQLNAMRQSSPTGGALGNVTEKELELLTSSVANLDPNKSADAFFGSLAEAKKTYLEMLARLDPNAPAEYSRKKGIRFDEQGNPTLFYVDGEDNRQKRDPFGVLPGQTPPDGSGGGDGGGFLSDLGRSFTDFGGDVSQVAGDTLGIIGNPVNATINSAFGTNLSTDLGKTAREASGMTQGNQTVSAINRGALSALSGSGLARGVASLTNPGAVQNALMTVGRAPVADMVAGGGAGLGGDIARRNNLGPAGEAAGMLVGGLAGNAGVTALAKSVGPRAASELGNAAARQGVDLLPADAGGKVSKIVTSAARSSPFSSNAIEQGAQRTQGQIVGAVDRVVASQGRPLTTDLAGEAVRKSANDYAETSAKRGNQLYDRAYQAAKGVKAIKPLQTIRAIDEQIARLSQSPDAEAASLAKELSAFRENIAKGVSIQGLRDARTRLSQGVYDGKMRGSQTQGMYRKILGNIADDIDAGLRAAGKPQAAQAFKVADKFWSDRVELIDKALEPIIGKDGAKSGEQIIQTVENMARGQMGGNARLSRLLGSMTKEEAGNVRATIIDRLGKATAGQQNAEGDAFSASTFLTNWNKLTPQAKASLFSDGELRQNLNDIAKIAEGTKASQSINNTSNTTAAFMGSAQGTVAASSITKAIVGAGAQILTGRLMSNPGFARLLAKAPATQNPAVVRKWTEQLGVLAAKEPLIANDARAVMDWVSKSLAQSPVSAAASEEEANGRRVPPKQ